MMSSQLIEFTIDSRKGRTSRLDQAQVQERLGTYPTIFKPPFTLKTWPVM